MANQKTYALVCLPVPKWQLFSYILPPALHKGVGPGTLVWVPVAKRFLVGMVMNLSQELPAGVTQFKEILKVLPEETRLNPKLLKLMSWAQGHYLAFSGEVLKSFFPATLLKNKKNKGEKARHKKTHNSFSQETLVDLNAEQTEAVQTIQKSLGSFRSFLLQGVTGSGKTEVYLRLCQEVLARGEGVLVLVPEIGLTPQILGRFVSRFDDQVAVYHSGCSEIQRLQTWWDLKEGRRQVVIGTRSAVYLPFDKLGLIVVDEEHDPSYKQEERFRYHGRDVAVMRAKIEGIPIVLGSATPSVESLENVKRAKYHVLRLRERATQGVLPEVRVIDLKEHPPDPKTLLTDLLAQKLEETLEAGHQALFFLNRRGFAPFLLCSDCGEVLRCPNCEISLTLHKRPHAMRCHYCEFHMQVPEQCPKCSGVHMKHLGAGTEKIEEEFQIKFPRARIGRLDRDISRSRRQTEELLDQFARGKLDILIGTQLVTKGHDFKNLTLVGVLLADMTLNQPDFRAAERIFQLMTQVAGRAGRHDKAGEVFLQTYCPDHYAIVSAIKHDADGFFAREAAYRQETEYPPFSRMVLLQLSGNQSDRVQKACRDLAKSLGVIFQHYPGVQILGPARANLEKLRGKYRWQILLRTHKFEAARRVLEAHLNSLERQLPVGVRLGVDVDPVGVF